MIKFCQKFIPLLVLIMMFQFSHLYAQESFTVRGTVKDSFGEMIGVNVVVKGTTTGTVTNLDGLYEITVHACDRLQFSFVG